MKKSLDIIKCSFCGIEWRMLKHEDSIEEDGEDSIRYTALYCGECGKVMKENAVKVRYSKKHFNLVFSLVKEKE